MKEEKCKIIVIIIKWQTVVETIVIGIVKSASMLVSLKNDVNC